MELPLTGDESVEAVLESYSGAHVWLNRHGLICTECGEVFWGTFQELAQYRKIEGDDYTKLLTEFNAFLAGES